MGVICITRSLPSGTVALRTTRSGSGSIVRDSGTKVDELGLVVADDQNPARANSAGIGFNSTQQ